MPILTHSPHALRKHRQAALREAGLESCELIVAVDFTKSNTWTGTKSYGGHSLHAVGEERWHGRNNPYEGTHVSTFGGVMVLGHSFPPGIGCIILYRSRVDSP